MGTAGSALSRGGACRGRAGSLGEQQLGGGEQVVAGRSGKVTVQKSVAIVVAAARQSGERTEHCRKAADHLAAVRRPRRGREHRVDCLGQLADPLAQLRRQPARRHVERRRSAQLHKEISVPVSAHRDGRRLLASEPQQPVAQRRRGAADKFVAPGMQEPRREDDSGVALGVGMRYETFQITHHRRRLARRVDQLRNQRLGTDDQCAARRRRTVRKPARAISDQTNVHRPAIRLATVGKAVAQLSFVPRPDKLNSQAGVEFPVVAGQDRDEHGFNFRQLASRNAPQALDLRMAPRAERGQDLLALSVRRQFGGAQVDEALGAGRRPRHRDRRPAGRRLP